MLVLAGTFFGIVVSLLESTVVAVIVVVDSTDDVKMNSKRLSE